MTRAFTLIELLVAVTIIVVLLALLAPAMDRAIYQAELAVCATQLKAIATGCHLYAAGSKRFYPARYWRTAGDGRPYGINYPGWGDDRPVFEGFITLQTFVDPMVDSIRLDAGSGAGADTWVYATRSVWAGWKYRGEYRGMLKLGDRMTYKDPDDAAKINTFNVLASDLDLIKSDLKEVHSAHPDVEARLRLWTVVDDPSPLPHQFSEWFTGDRQRGTVDAYNHAYDDGSVERFDDVELSHGVNKPGDERMRGVDIVHTGGSQYSIFVPPDR